MEIAQYILTEAKKILQYEGDALLPKKLADTEFFLAKAEDTSVFAFGSIDFNETEYKIGTKKT